MIIDYIEAVKDNDARGAKRNLLEASMHPDPRPTDVENGIFHGWYALHYAAYLNNTAMIGIIWNYER